MRKAIEQKLNSYKFLNPKSADFKNWVAESNVWMFVYSSLLVSGREVSKQDLVHALGGEIIPDFSVSLYMEIQKLAELFEDMKSCLAMQHSIDTKILARWAEILFGSSEYRSSNAAIFKWGIIPCRFLEIDEHLGEVFKAARGMECIDKAIYLHNEINRIYPFGKNSPEIALAAMYYTLMQGGYPMPTISVFQAEYDDMMQGYYKSKSEEFALMTERIILDRLEQIVQIALSCGDRQ